MPPIPLLALRATSPGRGSLSQGGRLSGAPFEGLSPQATGGVPLSSIIAVDLDVIVGQIAAPCLCGCIAGAHVHLDQHIVLSQHLGSFVLAVGVVGGVFAHIHLTGLAGKPHADLINGEIAGGVADGAQDAAPVGIAAEHCGLEQVGAHHAAADGTGGLQVGGRGSLRR